MLSLLAQAVQARELFIDRRRVLLPQPLGSARIRSMKDSCHALACVPTCRGPAPPHGTPPLGVPGAAEADDDKLEDLPLVFFLVLDRHPK